jgi:hypothetical protein
MDAVRIKTHVDAGAQFTCNVEGSSFYVRDQRKTD